MKRIFAHIGFSFALTLLVLNFSSVLFSKIVLGILIASFFITISFKKVRQALAVPIVIISAVFACLVFIISSSTTGSILALDKTTASTDFKIVSATQKNDDSYSYIIKTTSIEANNSPQNIKVKLNTDNKIGEVGEEFNSDLTFYKIGDNAFSSYGYFADNVFLTSKLHSLEKISSNENSFNYKISALRNTIENIIASSINGNAGKLAVALITGDKSVLPSSIVSNFRLLGVSHLMAVSGFHISIIIGTIYLLLKKIGLNGVICSSVSITVMIIYGAVAMFTPSVVRASIMMFLLICGDLFGKKADALNSLGIAVFIICLNPYAVSDLGFQLSTMSVLSLVTLAPIISKKVKIKSIFNKAIIETIICSFCVILYNIPFLWLSYGVVYLSSILLNVILMPLAEIAIIFCALLLLFSKIPYLAVSFAFIGGNASKLMITVTDFFSKHFALSYDVSSEFFGIICSSILFIFAVSFLMKNKRMMKISAFISCFIFLISSFLGYYVSKNNVYVRVSNGVYGQCILIYNDESSIIFGNLDYSTYYTYKDIITAKNLNNDLILCADNDDEMYNEKISTDVKTKYYVSHNIDEIDFANIYSQKIENKNDLVYNFTKNVIIQYNLVNDDYSFNVNVYNMSLSFSSENELINFSNNTIITNDYSDSDLIFTFSNNNSYSLRKENLWLI